jgi:hypothetical protein
VVKTPEGEGVEGALVAIIPDIEASAPDMRVKPAGTARSSAGGQFRIAGIRPGEYGATATAGGFVGAFRAGLMVLPGKTVSDVELVLDRGGVVLTGRISDSGGGPIPGAELRALAGPSGTNRTRVFQVLANQAGVYKMALPKGRYFLVADADGYAPDNRMVDTARPRRRISP